MSPSEPGAVSLRDVVDDDIPVFFDHQRDPVAVEMAAITSRTREDHLAKWQEVRSDETITKTILFEDEVAGHIVSWEEDGCQNVGYAIGRSLWGRGIATAALSQFLEIVKYRPLYLTPRPTTSARCVYWRSAALPSRVSPTPATFLRRS